MIATVRRHRGVPRERRARRCPDSRGPRATTARARPTRAHRARGPGAPAASMRTVQFDVSNAPSVIACARWSCQATTRAVADAAPLGRGLRVVPIWILGRRVERAVEEHRGRARVLEHAFRSDTEIRLVLVADHDHVGVGGVVEFEAGPGVDDLDVDAVERRFDGENFHPHVRRFPAADAVRARRLGVDGDGRGRDHQGRREQRSGATHGPIVAPRAVAERIRSQSRRRAPGPGRAAPSPRR